VIEKGCAVEGCERPFQAKGYCKYHWRKWKQFGDPLGGGTRHGEPMEFLKRAAISTDAECISWPYANSEGYARLRGVPAYRFVCEMVYGPPPTPKHDTAHSCGRGHLGCVNPNHLRWATRKENFSDKLEHGTDARGEKSPVAKLSNEQVSAIRSIAEVVPQGLIAQEFGISRSYVSRIVGGSKRVYG